MMIHCNVTGSERKRLADVLGAALLVEPIYKKAPTFAYVVSDYTIDKNGTIFCPVSASREDVDGIVAKLTDEGFTPEIEASAESPAETPDVAPEAEPEAQPEGEETEADVGAETPDVADEPIEADHPEENPFAAITDGVEEELPFFDEQDEPDEAASAGSEDDSLLTVSIPRDKLTDDALARLRIIVANKEGLFKRALLADDLPIEVTDENISFPWFKLTGISGETEAYSQFITALCQMATEQKRVLDKPYDGDNDRFTMRIFMVRMNMKGPQFALARKLMMKNLTGNSGWRYEDSATKPKKRNSSSWVAVRQLRNIYHEGARIELISINDETKADINTGDRGAVIGVDDNGSVFIRLENGSAFGIAFCTEAAEAPEALAPEDEPDTPTPDEDALPDEAEPDEEVSE